MPWGLFSPIKEVQSWQLYRVIRDWVCSTILNMQSSAYQVHLIVQGGCSTSHHVLIPGRRKGRRADQTPAY